MCAWVGVCEEQMRSAPQTSTQCHRPPKSQNPRHCSFRQRRTARPHGSKLRKRLSNAENPSLCHALARTFLKRRCLLAFIRFPLPARIASIVMWKTAALGVKAITAKAEAEAAAIADQNAASKLLDDAQKQVDDVWCVCFHVQERRSMFKYVCTPQLCKYVLRPNLCNSGGQQSKKLRQNRRLQIRPS